MTRISRFASPAALVAVGFGLGLLASHHSPVANAQQAAKPAVNVSVATAEKIKQASDALETAQTAVQQDGLYVPAIRGLNPYATLSGGLDALADLESGRGVDPITFAGLHAGLSIDEIAPHLGYDANGRLTYKGKLVRIYSVERMRRLNAQQAAVLEIAAGGRRAFAQPQP